MVAQISALQALDVRAQRSGFSPIYQHGGQFWCKYGPILVRVFVEHCSPTQWMFTLTAHNGAQLPSIIEVAEYLVEEQDQHGITIREYKCAQTHFDVAGLVLP